jgi:hypothetical protein
MIDRSSGKILFENEGVCYHILKFGTKMSFLDDDPYTEVLFSFFPFFTTPLTHIHTYIHTTLFYLSLFAFLSISPFQIFLFICAIVYHVTGDLFDHDPV